MEDLRLEDIPVMNCGQFIVNEMKKYGDRNAFAQAETGATMTFKQVVERTELVAAGLQKIGVQADDVICMVSTNSFDCIVAFYASSLIYAVYQPINPLLTKDDIKRCLSQCGTKFIVTAAPFLDKVKSAVAEMDNIKIIVMGESDEFTTFESLADPSNDQYTVIERDPKTTTAALMSSSGTTGFPKPAILTHFSIVCQALQMRCTGFSERNLIVFMPMFHITGLTVAAYYGHSTGSQLVVMVRFQLDLYLQMVQKYKPTGLALVPPVMVLLSKYPNLEDFDLSSVKWILCGAAPLSKKVADTVQARMKLDHIHQAYGMTEIGATHMFDKNDYRYHSVGRLMPLVEIRIVDVETEEVLGTNQEGEIWLRGPSTCKGYLNLPKETENLITKDGWVRTGDIGKENEDKHLYIVDRIKELIKYKGFQVGPATLEDILHGHDAVADVGVVGMPDEEAGELPRAYVALKPGKSAMEQELVEFVNERVMPQMKLRGGVKFVDEITRTASGKILRRSLREDAIQYAATKSK